MLAQPIRTTEPATYGKAILVHLFPLAIIETLIHPFARNTWVTLVERFKPTVVRLVVDTVDALHQSIVLIEARFGIFHGSIQAHGISRKPSLDRRTAPTTLNDTLRNTRLGKHLLAEEIANSREMPTILFVQRLPSLCSYIV